MAGRSCKKGTLSRLVLRRDEGHTGLGQAKGSYYLASKDAQYVPGGRCSVFLLGGWRLLSLVSLRRKMQSEFPLNSHLTCLGDCTRLMWIHLAKDGRHKPLELAPQGLRPCLRPCEKWLRPCPICMEGFTSDGMPRTKCSWNSMVCIASRCPWLFERANFGRTCRKCSNSFHQAELLSLANDESMRKACLSEWAKKEQQIKWEACLRVQKP